MRQCPPTNNRNMGEEDEENGQKEDLDRRKPNRQAEELRQMAGTRSKNVHI